MIQTSYFRCKRYDRSKSDY